MDSNFPDRLPKPGPGRGGTFRAAFWAFVALLLLGGLAFWLFSEPGKREELREQAADKINELASGTPLSGIGDILRDSPPPLPPEILNPPTASGTLSGRQVTGTIASPPDMAGGTSAPYQTDGFNGRQVDPSRLTDTETSTETPILANIFGKEEKTQDKPVFSSEPLPPATEDSRVKPGYMNELADWLATRYRPGPSGGTLELSPRSLNNLFGAGIAEKTKGGRSALLRYAFQSSMLDGLYKLYINQFMSDLDQAAAKRGFNAQESRDFHQAIAGKAATYAAALSGILQVPDLGERLARIEALGQKSVEENAQLAEAVFELDELRNSQASRTQIDATQMRVTGITARYRRALDDQEAAQRALAAEIRKQTGPGLDEESLLFMASWVQRRLAEDGSASSALQTTVEIMRDLARRCSEAAPGHR